MRPPGPETVQSKAKVTRLQVGDHVRVIRSNRKPDAPVSSRDRFGWALVDRDDTVIVQTRLFARLPEEAADHFETARKIMSHPVEAQVQRHIEVQATAIASLNEKCERIMRTTKITVKRLTKRSRRLVFVVAMETLALIIIGCIAYYGG